MIIKYPRRFKEKTDAGVFLSEKVEKLLIQGIGGVIAHALEAEVLDGDLDYDGDI